MNFLAQIAAVEKATDKLLDYGAIGIVVLFSGLAVWLLYRELRAVEKRNAEQAEKDRERFEAIIKAERERTAAETAARVADAQRYYELAMSVSRQTFETADRLADAVEAVAREQRTTAELFVRETQAIRNALDRSGR